MLAGAFQSSVGPRLLRYALIGAMATPRVDAYVEMEFVGQGQGWTDVTTDVAFTGWDLDRGLSGITPSDRCAKTGTWKFAMRNDPHVSGGVLGYYSPDHVNCRPGFREGINVRLVFNVLGTRTILFTGEIDVIEPTPGLYADKTVACTAVDWMDRAAKTPMGGIATQQSKRSDQLIAAVVAIVPKQPLALQLQTGLDTYPFALDTTYDGETYVIGELQKIALSELGLVYVRGDGTLVFESRKSRPTSSGVVDTFLDTEILDLKLSRSRALVISRVQTTVYPRQLGATTTDVLYSLATASQVGPGATIVIGPNAYRDPANLSDNIGAINQQALVAGTDYTLNSLADGTGADLTPFCLVAATYSSNSVTFTVVNNSTQTAYLTKLQCRGQVVRSYGSAILDQQDAVTRDLYGQNVLRVDMAYQNDPAVGADVSTYLLNQLKTPITQIPQITIEADAYNLGRLARVLARDVSDRIAVQETVSGLATSRAYFINAVKYAIDAQLNVTVTWALAPADQTQYWLLEVVGRSELDQTTVLGYGLVFGHIDVAHADVHGDVAHGDVTHGDSNHSDALHADQHNDSTHGDAVHSDTAHVDTPHQDSHIDTVHADTAHSDAAHADSHSDSAHSDSHSDTVHTDTHSDDHTDSAHADDVHTDVAHNDSHGDDGAPSNESHVDSHSDDPHYDNAHNDVAHGDVAHTDTHGDVTHVDTHVDTAHGDTHNDTVHGDTAHADATHVDIHADAAHVDTAHADVAHADGGHSDSHSDTAHGDTPHSDSPHTDAAHSDAHGDTAHGDQ
jgi:hypothetical protein